jgi:F-type H+-transporting ATPase subunit beta
MSHSTGNVSQVIGPVVDVSFDTANTTLPNIYDSLEIQKKDGSLLVLEVIPHWRGSSSRHFNGLNRWT